MCRSSRPDVFCKKGVLRNFTKFTGKHLCQSLFFNKVLGLLQLKFWSVFDIFDPRIFQHSVTEISSYRNQEISVLIDHYSKEKTSSYRSVTINQVGDIDGVAAIEEWPGFHKYMFKKQKAKEEKFQMNLMNCKNEKERHFSCSRDLFWCTQVIFNMLKW